MSEFIELTNDGERFTCEMPQDETVIEVRLTTGSIRKAYYCCNLMEPGDYDFLPVDEDNEPLMSYTLAEDVEAWRPLA